MGTHLLLLLQFVPDLHFTSGEAFSQRQHRHTPSFPTTYAAITRWAADSSMGVARVACLLVPLVASSLLSLVSPALAEAGTGPADAVPPQDKHRILSENLFLEAATKLAKQHKRVDAEWWERLDDEAAGETSLLFATPMFRSNLHLKYAPEEVKDINDKLSAAILEHYMESVRAYVGGEGNASAAPKAEEEEDGEYAINDDFFAKQQEVPFLPALPVMQELAKDFIVPSIKKYWRSVSSVDPKLADDIVDIQDFKLWATVNHWDISHQLHVHTGSIFSGVYYVKVPPTAGGFRAVDPRGHPQYPFQHSVTVNPEEGDLVIFPGWMPHTVLPTMGGDPRIAIAFNIDGDIDAWADMTSIEHSYQVL